MNRDKGDSWFKRLRLYVLNGGFHTFSVKKVSLMNQKPTSKLFIHFVIKRSGKKAREKPEFLFSETKDTPIKKIFSCKIYRHRKRDFLVIATKKVQYKEDKSLVSTFLVDSEKALNK